MEVCPHSGDGETWNVLLSAYRILASSEALLDHYGLCLLWSPLLYGLNATTCKKQSGGWLHA